MDRKPIYRPQPWNVTPKDSGEATCLVPPGSSHGAPGLGGPHLNPVTAGSRNDLRCLSQNRDDPIPSPESVHAPTRRPGILVVDDDVGVRALLSEVLWQQGFIVWLAGNGLQALELYKELGTDIDLVLMDIQMPRLDGPQTLTALKRLHPGICCCFMTADTGNYSEKELFERGAIHIFRKPFRLHEIARALWEMVKSPELDPAASGNQGKHGDTVPELFLG